jgi:hypothetical protein
MGEVGYRLSNRVRLVLAAFNIFDANVSDIEYFHASRLPGEPAGGVERRTGRPYRFCGCGDRETLANRPKSGQLMQLRG